MEDINYIVTKGFSLRPKSIFKRKSFYIVNTNKGLYRLKSSNANPQKIIFEQEIKEHLHERGVDLIDRFRVSNQNTPYFKCGETLYTMATFQELPEIDFSNPAQYLDAIRNIALLHNELTQISFSNYVAVGSNDFILEYSNAFVEWQHIRKKINKQKSFTDFDIYYIQTYDAYAQQIEESIQRLIETNFQQKNTDTIRRHEVCHSLLKEENILSRGDGLFIQNFSESCVQPQILDLCFLIRRYLKVAPQEKIPVQSIVDCYAKYHSATTDKDAKMIYPLLKFPHKYLKLCREYYSKKRTWAPSAILQKMDSIVMEKEEYTNYIDDLKTL